MADQHGDHFRDVCEFGYVHGQCRCASPGKYERKVRCDQSQKHRPTATVPPPPPPSGRPQPQKHRPLPLPPAPGDAQSTVRRRSPRKKS